jgi:hypothetical protein
MRSVLAVSLTLPLALASAAAAAQAPAELTNARVETRSAAAGLEGEARAVMARGGPLWFGYLVPTVGRHQNCCWHSSDEASSGHCGGCRLEAAKGEGAFRPEGKAPVALEGTPRLRLLYRVEGGRVAKVRTFSEDCWLDAGGLPFVWLEGVSPAQSVAWLTKLMEEADAGGAPEPEEERKGKWKAKSSSDAVLAAIAFHAEPGADAALERWTRSDQPLRRRKQAVFWMGQARGARGREVLARLVRQDPDPKLREHVVFALSQSREPGAVDDIVEVAKKDQSAHVRGQALFWLAQTAAKRAPAAIRAALDEDPETAVKKKAVFALSQLPKEQGVPLLIDLARTHRNHEVRKQAMFWLGQSGDSRALAFFEEVLKKR